MKKIVFFGGKLIGYKCLKTLCDHTEIDVRLVISNTSDLVKNDNRWYPKIYELSRKYGVKYKAIDKPNTSEVIEQVRNVKPDFIFVVYYDAILKPELFKTAKYSAVNLHLADAEKYRGCYPTTYAIINGEEEYGVTMHYIDEGVDTGPIIGKDIFKINDNITGRELYDMATEKGYQLFVRYLDAIITDKVIAKTQKPSKSLKYYKRSQFPSHCIDFSGSGKEVFNRIRALIFPPFPYPYFYIEGKKYFICDTDKGNGKNNAKEEN